MGQTKTIINNDKVQKLEDIKVLVETAREPFLILDKDLRIIEADNSFYDTFKVAKKF